MMKHSIFRIMTGRISATLPQNPAFEALPGASISARHKFAMGATGLALTLFVITIAWSGATLLSNSGTDRQMTASTSRDTTEYLRAAPTDDATSPSILATREPTSKTSIGPDVGSPLDTTATPVVTINQPHYHSQVLKVKRGDVLMNMLIDADIDRQQAYYAIESLKKVYNPRKLRVGQQVNVTMETPAINAGKADPEPRLFGLEIKTDFDQRVAVGRSETGDFVSQKIQTKLNTNYTRAGGTIDSSLYMAALDAGIPDAVIVELIAIFSYDIDFQREIRKGDDFEVYFTRLYDGQGQAVKTGNIEYAAMTVRGKEKGYYRFKTPDDKITDYYDAKGQSAKKFLMRTPVNGARISSGFGRRKHPVLGYQKAHKGTDFAAPTGTPVMAAGNGIIERSSRYGSYGNYVRIRHAKGYKTAYAHLSRYGPGIKSGRRVKQGQIIGYVGATGRVTGAHLHYEVIKDGKKVNPLKIRVPTGRKLNGDILKTFQDQRLRLDTEIAALPDWRTIQTVDAGSGPQETSTN